MTSPNVVLVATDLTQGSDLALVRGRAHADATAAALVVCHVLPDVLRHHPLAPRREQSDAVQASEWIRRAADLTTAQIHRVLGEGAGEHQVVVEVGVAADEIVRIAEERRAHLVVVGGAAGLGRVAEKVVRYTHCSVLVARPGPASHKIVVATDFADDSTPALRLAATLVRAVGVDATLLHVFETPSTILPSILSPLGDAWTPPAKGALDELRALGQTTLEGLAAQYGLSRSVQRDGDPAHDLVSYARAAGVEMILVGSRGKSGIKRMLLGSVAERVVREAPCSVMVARGTA